MLPGPIFRREVQASARFRELFVVRVALALALGGIAVLAGLSQFDRAGWDRGLYRAGSLHTYAELVFAAGIGVEIFSLSLLTVATVSPSIAEEREKATLPLLLLTRLTRFELIATKLAGRLMPSLLLTLTGLPLFAGSVWWPGVRPRVLVELVAMSATSLVVAGSLAILASARNDGAGAARQQAMGWTIMWLVGFPVIAIMRAPSGTLWGDLLVEARRLSSWLARSSPVSLVTDSSWLAGTGAGTLSHRLVVMLALQAIVISLALGGAVASLRLREPHPSSWDQDRGYRPPVGDDPIFWREYVLPWRGTRMPTVMILARRILMVLRTIVMLVIQLVFLTLAALVSIGLVIGALWFGYFAFRELWVHGYFVGGPYRARNHLNLFIRFVTAVLGMLSVVGVPGDAANRITIERDKKTWESLLTTPLTGAEILAAKMRVTARGFWSAGRWLIPLWVLGIACGAVHPLGALVAAVELPLAAWAGLVLGTWLAIRPDSTTRATSSASALWSLGLMFQGGLAVVMPLCSGRELAEFGSWDARLRWLAVVGLLASTVLMATFAWSLTRRCFEHFDEWVGRPHRATAIAPAASRSLAVAHTTDAISARDDRVCPPDPA